MSPAVTPTRTLALLRQGITDGLHIGAQLFAAINGTPLINLAIGNARLAGGAGDFPSATDIPMTPDTLMLWLSAGKPITAVAIAMLQERGLLQFDDPVAHYFPEFAQNDKNTITVRHLLTHTAGIRALDTAYPFATWDETLSKIAAMKLERDWIPGQRAGYHTHASWYVLGELINRLTHTPHDHWIRQNIFLPLGMTDTHLAFTPEQYASYGTRIGYLYDTTPSPPHPIHNYDTPFAASHPRPSASCRGPIQQLAIFYEMLRNHGTFHGTKIISPETVFALTSRQRLGMFDHTFRATLDWGLGIILNSVHYAIPPATIPYQFGPHASANTFGHGGSQSSTGFCDPEHNLVVSLLFNGCPGEPQHDKRLRSTLKALYEDLNLVISA